MADEIVTLNVNEVGEGEPDVMLGVDASGNIVTIGSMDAAEVPDTYMATGPLGEIVNKTYEELAADAAPYLSLVPFTAAVAGTAASIGLLEDTNNGVNKVLLRAPANLSSDIIVILPNGAGTLLGTADLGVTNLFVPAFAMTPAFTSGAEPGSLETTTNKLNINYLGFDTGAAEYAHIQLMFPGRWTGGTIKGRPLWMHPATTVNFGVAFSLQGLSLADGEDTDAAWGTAVTTTDTGGVTNRFYIGPETGDVTLAGAPGAMNSIEMQFLRVTREVANGADNLAVDARLIGWMLSYVAGSLKDA